MRAVGSGHPPEVDRGDDSIEWLCAQRGSDEDVCGPARGEPVRDGAVPSERPGVPPEPDLGETPSQFGRYFVGAVFGTVVHDEDFEGRCLGVAPFQGDLDKPFQPPGAIAHREHDAYRRGLHVSSHGCLPNVVVALAMMSGSRSWADTSAALIRSSPPHR